MTKQQYNQEKREAFNRNRIKENAADKSGNHRPRRPVKTRVVKAEDLNLDFGSL